MVTKFDELFPLQIVINLDKRPDRLEICMEKEFPKIKVHPIRKAGNIFTGANSSWWNGAIGCMLSHYEVLEAAACLNTNVFIFEDDISFIEENPHSILETACKELKTLDWDMFYIGGNLLKPATEILPHLARLTHCQSTVAYGVNKNFVKTLLKSIDLNKISKPIDMIYADDIIPNNKCYISIPMLVIQRDSYSDIEGQEVKYTDYLEKRYWGNLIKKP
jgi:GR25 family glycosyltransferase involved in LPS biosynthesis